MTPDLLKIWNYYEKRRNEIKKIVSDALKTCEEKDMKKYRRWEFIHGCAVPFTFGLIIGFVIRMQTKPCSKAFIIGECVLIAFGVTLSVVSGIMRNKCWREYADSFLDKEEENDRR